MQELIEGIKKSEGFVGVVYKDSLGIDTIGYGTRMPLDEEEAALILEHRLNKKIEHLLKEKPFIRELSINRQNVLFEMAYQLGVNGLLGFKKMFNALENKDYRNAKLEGLDSKWRKQTPLRAKRMMDIIAEGQ